jgi:hypothetical protein
MHYGLAGTLLHAVVYAAIADREIIRARPAIMLGRNHRACRTSQSRVVDLNPQSRRIDAPARPFNHVAGSDRVCTSPAGRASHVPGFIVSASRSASATRP